MLPINVYSFYSLFVNNLLNLYKLPYNFHFDPNAQNLDIRHHKVNLFPLLCIFSMFLKQFSFQKNKLEQTKYVHQKCIYPKLISDKNISLLKMSLFISHSKNFWLNFIEFVKRNTAICCKQVQINKINMYQLYIISNNLKFTYRFNVPKTL